MRMRLAVFVLIFPIFGAFGDEPVLVEGAKRATAYWDSMYGRCNHTEGLPEGWYGVLQGADRGSIQMVPVIKIRFQTEDLSQVEILNGYEFKATTSLEQGAFRWWISGSKSWRDWEVGEISPPVVIVKKNGVWSIQAPQHRTLPHLKAITTCSEVPRMEKK